MAQGFDSWGKSEGVPSGPLVEEPRWKPGCFFYGCITGLVFLLVSVVGVFLVYRYVTGTIRHYVETYTDPAPRALPVVEVPEEQRQAIVKRAEAFQKAIKTPPAPDVPRVLTDEERTLVLTAEELNVLFQQTPEVRGKFFVTLADDRIKARMSLPLHELPGLQGRHLNGEANVEASVVDGQPVVQLRDVRVKGQPLPDSLRTMIEGLNLAGGELVTEEGKGPPAPLAHLLETIEVKDGTLTIRARKEPEPRVAPTSEGVVRWRPEDGGNGHFYELVRRRETWTEAIDDAEARTHQGLAGHLVTITSAAENAFLRDRIAVNESAWIGLTDDPDYGGKESRERPDPKHDGWAWVTGEKVEFVAWSEGEPSHGDEHFGAFNGLFGPRRGEWNDLANSPGGGRVFIVEYEPATTGESK